MKNRLLGVLLGTSIIGNLILGALLWREQASRFERPQMDALSSEEHQARTAESSEQLFFLRDFLSRWFQFRSATYQASQTALLPWLSSSFAQERRAEVARLAVKMSEQDIEQRSQLLSIREISPGEFESLDRIELIENEQTTSFTLQTRLTVTKASRQSDNIWGFQVHKLESKVLRERPLAPKDLPIAEHHLLQLTLPCPVRVMPDLEALRIKSKVVSNRSSEIHLLAEAPLLQPVTLKIACDRLEFEWLLSTSNTNFYRYLSVENSFGKPKLAPGLGKNRKEIKHSLAKELGFEIEEKDTSESR